MMAEASLNLFTSAVPVCMGIPACGNSRYDSLQFLSLAGMYVMWSFRASMHVVSELNERIICLLEQIHCNLH